MPSDLVSRISLDQLHPEFLRLFLELLARCKAQNVNYYATLGYRTVAEQDALFAKGRNKPGPVVTNAPGGLSFHNYGLAVDVVRDSNFVKVGLQPAWEAKAYDLLHTEGKALGLQVGIFNDKGERYDFGHVSLPWSRTGRREKSLLTDLRKLRSLEEQWHLSSTWLPQLQDTK